MIGSKPLWIFGYGSLVWRPAFSHCERRPGFVEGWARRFWQGSTDHRGVPDAPGRVVTLVEHAGARCWGVVYRVARDAAPAVLRALDDRESGGFERLHLEVRSQDAEPVQALVYVAGPGNPNFLGPAPAPEIARQIRRARGPSGPNLEYLLELRDALRQLGADDAHVAELADLASVE